MLTLGDTQGVRGRPTQPPPGPPRPAARWGLEAVWPALTLEPHLAVAVGGCGGPRDPAHLAWWAPSGGVQPCLPTSLSTSPPIWAGGPRHPRRKEGSLCRPCPTTHALCSPKLCASGGPEPTPALSQPGHLGCSQAQGEEQGYTQSPTAPETTRLSSGGHGQGPPQAPPCLCDSSVGSEGTGSPYPLGQDANNCPTTTRSLGGPE